MLIVLGLALMVCGVAGYRAVGAATQLLINWGDLTPNINPNPDFLENAPIASETDTYFSIAANPHLDPYHGLGSSTGGLSGFSSQIFPNVSGSGVTMTVYYSDNNWDDHTLEGPDLYQPGPDPNPDRRVTGEYGLRINRDHVGTRTPTTVVLVFSQPVHMDEFLIGSLSRVDGSYEHAVARAFASNNATGPVVKASGFVNISNLSTCATLLFNLCVDDGPFPTNLLSNVVIDPDLTDGNADGVYDNVGSVSDNGIYHVYGSIVQPSGYGRVKLIYGTEYVQSIAVSFFPTSDANGSPFTDTDYTAQWISAIVAPHTFTPQGATAITLSQGSASVQNPGLFILGVALIVLAVVSVLTLRQRYILRQNVNQ
jgi:hypothetical protein